MPAKSPSQCTPAVLVVGSGVIGLSTAIVLAEVGHRVGIVARDFPPETTSDVAGAFWYPFLAEPRDRVSRWAAQSLARFGEIARDPQSGVAIRRAVECCDDGTAPRRVATPDLRRARRDELPLGSPDGQVFSLPVADMPRYLPWLCARFERLGGRRARAELRGLGATAGAAERSALDEAAERAGVPDARVVVDCAGLGARELARDPELFAIRGQVVLVRQREIDRVLIDDRDATAPMYVVPRSADCVVGGSVGVGDEDLTVDPDLSARILVRATAQEPRLRDAEVVGARVGLRPGRREVRLELDAARGPDRRAVVHAYGHGGAGVSLSWGCAEEVLELIRSVGAGQTRESA